MTVSSHASAGLRFRLREATAEAHRKVEAAMALTERCADRASYRALLCDLLGLYGPLEANLAALNWEGLGINVAQRAKAPWLHADLLSLGLSRDDIAALPRATRLPAIHSVAEGFGVLYVLEGATLGGQVVLRQIKPALGVVDDLGAQFFASYGASVGERWRAFVAAMSVYGADARRAQAMEGAALSTFNCFLGWMNERAAHTRAGTTHVH